jgi:D-serine dehydratase
MGRPNLLSGQVRLPALVLKEPALENNLAVMAAYASRHGFVLAPHGKTTMAPELFRRQLAAGAWGITVANIAQAEVAFGAGAQRVLVANEVVSRPDAFAIAEALGASATRELYCLADSVAGVRLLDEALGGAGFEGTLGVLVEVGSPGGRAGARSEAEALEVASALAQAKRLRLAGVEGYEGVLADDRSPEALAKVDAYLAGLRQVFARLLEAGAFAKGYPVLVSAGGSKYFDRVAALLGTKSQGLLGTEGQNPQAFGGPGSQEVLLVARSGCYLVHDHGTYAQSSPLAAGAERLLPALELWAEVLSTPEPGLAIVGLGKRDAPYDLGLPTPLALLREGSHQLEPLRGAELERLNDQHGYLHLGPSAPPLGPGDRVSFGISHPCTAFDKWRTVLLVGDDYEVTGEIRTFFH